MTIDEIEKLRVQKGYKTKTEFATAIGYNPQYYIDLTNGSYKTTMRSLRRIFNLAKNI
jgi:hypothetical protein